MIRLGNLLHVIQPARIDQVIGLGVEYQLYYLGYLRQSHSIVSVQLEKEARCHVIPSQGNAVTV